MSADPSRRAALDARLALDASARKARAVVLDPRMGALQAFAVVAAECVEHWTANEGMLVQHRTAPYLHQMRVGIRRLRSAFSLFRPVLGEIPDDPAHTLAHRLRALALPFGQARDLDVLLSGPLVLGLDERQVAALVEDRDAAHDTVLAILHSPEWAAVKGDLTSLLAQVPGWRGDPTAQHLATAALEKRARRVVGACETLEQMTPAERHEVRIESKKLRYGCEFFASIFPDGDRATTRVTTPEGVVLTGPLAYGWYVEQVQTTLGELNDHATADRLLHHVGAHAPTVDEPALVAGGAAACRKLADRPPFWR